ncbi:DUF4747 family protein [Flavobacterium enshiense]|uniref:DUF4747 family protein n=1 Tax=Flavobacterium enshiense TaxID=1341165 RepID=UPI00345DC17A
MSKILFNRLHLTVPEGVNKKVFYIDGIRSAAAAGFKDYAYKIVDVETHDDFIVGTLIKYDPYGKGEYFDEKKGKVEKGGTTNSIVAKSIFVIQVSESVIAFKDVPNIISRMMFTRMFTELFKINCEGKDFDFSMTSITEQYSFVEKVSTLKQIKKITISLVPSNPRNADIWKSMDERLRNNNIAKYKEVQETNKPGGITIDEETKSKMIMSEDGYGESTAQGFDESGANVTITTKQHNKEVSAVLPVDIESTGDSKTIINYLKATFDKISLRTKKA